ncbi:MAG: SH3-like domain-containing protein [Rhodospirillales bacterium]
MSARFAVGERVRIREAYPPGHVRTPFYLRGKEGVVSRLVAELPNPEERAYGRDGLPPVPVYWVLFRQAELWPDYQGPEGDTAEVDVQEHWLEPLEEDGG